MQRPDGVGKGDIKTYLINVRSSLVNFPYPTNTNFMSIKAWLSHLALGLPQLCDQANNLYLLCQPVD
jgi:hypothetical protein